MLLKDGTTRHPKMLRAGAEACWMWACAIDYARNHLTDGVVPTEALATLAVFKTRPAKLAEVLVSVRLFEVVEGGYVVHDFLDENDSREDVLRKRREDAERKRTGKGRTASAESDGTDTGIQTDSDRNPDGPNLLARPRERVGVGVGSSPGGAEGGNWRDEAFLRLSTLYPNKDRRRLAREAFEAAVSTPAQAEAVCADVARRVKSGWVRVERRFIPQLHRFLTERQWEDPVAVEDADDWTAALPHAWTCPKCGDYHEGTKQQKRAGWCPGPTPPKPRLKVSELLRNAEAKLAQGA